MIFFISPDSNQPIGGIKQIYRHAQILHDSGIEAFVLHGKPKQRCTWFEHHARTAYASADAVRRVTRAIGQHVGWRRALAEAPLTPGRELFLELEDGRTQRHLLSADDILVVPEVQTALVEGNTEGRIVVFNQNTHNTFRSLPIGSRKRSPIYSMNIVVAAVTVSEQNRRYLEFAFPSLRVLRVTNGVDTELFRPGPRKQRRIAFMPRKLGSEIAEVFNLMRERNVLEGWTLAPIDGMAEAEVAAELQRSMVYLSTCEREGFGLPPVEAGMCGCVVVGYTGSAAGEYLEPRYCFPVPQGDTLAFAMQLEKTLRWCEADEQAAIAKGLEFSEFLRGRYSLEHERSSVLETWRGLLAS